ncbi:peptidase domain-containing ABC transporter [Pedobacter heparinus]|uniref:ABC transporter related n=1 Tax=Pedobacter heparinus (strain ATCC 13125 / DSM 2366 / CIP 104194 / JCM 7457 / NBRC 12017 / NCIMB 9290 / NRRL B-14731 / HIM 762-3) TaxID=485917 RepID=C6Y0M0_PEDHD|nr:peptidase domain-containing ABC transporter [Pedobacter heparinus]ACU02781.1 ABC transporter related [Pedobacter heparinus DSM 2366]
MKFPHYKQHDKMDCGPTCLRMVAKYYGRNYSLRRLRELCQINREGVSLLGISEAAEKVGFRSSGVKIDLEQLKEAELPCILHWRQNHFVVLYRIEKGIYYVADPAKALISYTEKEFTRNWVSNKELYDGIALFISPTPKFYEEEGEKNRGLSWSFLLRYRYAYSRLIVQLFFGLGIGSILQLITPFLMQSVVDIGINTRNINFIYLILIAQVMLFLGSASVNFIRSWIMLHMTTRINVSILTDFLTKLMRLPMNFFDTKMTGDIMQRMGDHKRIEGFLTGTTLNTLFSFVNLIVFGVVLAYYNTGILLIFLISTSLYAAWILLFMKRRRELDFKRFDNSSKNQSNMIELIGGIQEIKLHNCEQQKRWQWESIQATMFKVSIKSLALSQYQQAGSMFINQAKNILISFISAKAVIDGHLSLGGMMAVQYMVGQLNSPIEQFLGLIQSFQDAKISLERLNEVHQMEDEESTNKHWNQALPTDRSIRIANLTFRYPGAGNEPVLEKINLDIPQGKTTAIVGMSGSGKTTILKLLMRFYEPEKGEIEIGTAKLSQLSFKVWRNHCGMVMQDGFIFSDSIANNIGVSDEYPDLDKLQHAIKIANIEEFVDSLPLGLNTKIGSGGNGISQGQKQRILIARAVYKDPEYIFFDEATNSLDANNERVIMDNLQDFFAGKTVVVVAHRLSTVKNADNIVVLDKGRIIEQGTHAELSLLKGEYFGLVKNQLELAM